MILTYTGAKNLAAPMALTLLMAIVPQIGCQKANKNPAGTINPIKLTANTTSPTGVLPAIKPDYPFSVKKDSTLYKELTTLGFSGKDVQEIVTATKSIYDLTRLIPGTRYRLLYGDSPEIAYGGVEFHLSSTQTLTIWRNAKQEFQSNLEKKTVTIRTAQFSGTVESSLWSSAAKAKMDRQLIADLTEVFAWQIDFTREVRENDHWRLVVEQEFVDNEPVGWGRILAADYTNGSKKYEAVYFEKEGEVSGYFSPDGKSLEKMFLRSPIEFARITSGFNLRRFHPILNTVRPHLGVDYAAAIGTPIRAIGDGRIAEARFTNGGGNTLVLTHNSIYKTRYLHLKSFARGIHGGSTVKQGQIIGYVGMTGLSTGPHLHFEFYQNGRYRDPLKVDFPSAEAVPEKYLSEFQTVATQNLALLPSGKVAARQTASSTMTE